MNRKALIAGLKAEIAALAAKGDDVTDEDLASIEAKSAEIATHEADEAKAVARDATMAKGLAFLTETNAAKAATAEEAKSEVAQGTQGTPGEVFVKSEQYDRLLKSNQNGIPSGVPVSMGAVNVGGVKALLTNPHLAPAQHVVAPVGLAITGLTDAITVVDNAPESIKIFRAAFTDATAVVAEGVAKPEATLTWSSTTINLDTLAQHLPVTVQALAHNGILRSMIDTFLVNGVKAKVEAAVATMLAAEAGLGVQAYVTDLRTTLRKAITKAQNAGRLIGAVPTGILISANDAETLDLEQLANLVLVPGEAPAQVGGIWRTPLVVSPQIADGFAYVGDLRQIVLYASGGVKVMTGWINAQFTENELTILAETEAKSTVIVAPAIIKADLTSA